MKKKILIVVACILAILGVLCGIYFPNSDINNTISEVQNTITEEIENIDAEETTEVIVSEETEEIVRDTIQSTIERRRFINIRRNRKF